MDELLINLKNKHLIPITIILGFSVWLVMCYSHYKSFWFDTIYRVQTVDFNLLHHTLPITLSELIAANRSDLIQKVLDANYGLFGLVITDGAGDTILYKTDAIYHRRSWQKFLSIANLNEADKYEKFDYLTNPVPIGSFKEHISPRDTTEPIEVGEFISPDQLPKPKIIGRVYYLREIPPSFMADLTNFLTTGVFDISQTKRGYLIISYCVIILMTSLLAFIYLRKQALNYKKQELQMLTRELEIKRRALENLASQLAANKSRKMWLEREAKEMTLRANRLKSSLTELKIYFDRLNGKIVNNKINLNNSNQSNQPNQILEEASQLIPELTQSALNLSSQANSLQEQCYDLENKRLEMEKIIDKAFSQVQTQSEYHKTFEVVN